MTLGLAAAPNTGGLARQPNTTNTTNTEGIIILQTIPEETGCWEVQGSPERALQVW